MAGRWLRSVVDFGPEWRSWTALWRWVYPYALLAIATFLLGAIAGAGAMAMTSPQALADAADGVQRPALYPDTLTVWSVFSNNVIALAVIAGGTISFGLLTLAGLFFNGLLIGTVVYMGAMNDTLGQVLALVLPHGVVEFSAFFIVGGVAYRIMWRLVAYLRGGLPYPITRQEAVEAAGLFGAAVLALALAAWIEVELTTDIARLVVDFEPAR